MERMAQSEAQRQSDLAILKEREEQNFLETLARMEKMGAQAKIAEEIMDAGVEEDVAVDKANNIVTDIAEEIFFKNALD